MQLGQRGMSDQRSGDDPELAADFGLAVTPHLPAMLRTAAALIGAGDAEDATQEAILRAWQSWHTLRDGAALRSWLLRITAHICQDWQRGRFGTRRARTQPLLDEDALPLGLLGDDPGTSDSTGALDLRHAINRLDADQRIVVVLRYYAQMDATEIGAALNLPPATVRTRLRRALAQLRERLSRPITHEHDDVADVEKGGC
ncbi:MAG TPA: RNA polymerase sigma factor [Ktedonobacterales bacterium]|nr:RNA polymerase sigma factor [Ktedonobacterales bacterium]